MPPLLKNLPQTSIFSLGNIILSLEKMFSMHCSSNSPLSLNDVNNFLRPVVSIFAEVKI